MIFDLYCKMHEFYSIIHYFSLQCHMIRNHSNIMIWCSRNNSEWCWCQKQFCSL